MDWDVFLLFLIPVGGGIPGGVILAKSRHIEWPWMALMYLLSDVVLACVLEPTVLLILSRTKKSPAVIRMIAAFQLTVKKTTAYYGNTLGPLALILIALGVDPMTGRAAAASVGHGFIVGWSLAIAGDMIYFFILMASTFWLNQILGDGTWATVIILIVMTIVPIAVRKFRERGSAPAAL